MLCWLLLYIDVVFHSIWKSGSAAENREILFVNPPAALRHWLVDWFDLKSGAISLEADVPPPHDERKRNQKKEKEICHMVPSITYWMLQPLLLDRNLTKRRRTKTGASSQCRRLHQKGMGVVQFDSCRLAQLSLSLFFSSPWCLSRTKVAAALVEMAK